MDKITLNDMLQNPNKDVGEMFEEKQATIAKQIEKKQEFIKESQDKKQNSMRDFAIKRDACMFACAEYSKLKLFGSKKTLIELHQHFIDYFETIY